MRIVNTFPTIWGLCNIMHSNGLTIWISSYDITISSRDSFTSRDDELFFGTSSLFLCLSSAERTFSFSLSLLVMYKEVDDFCAEKSKVATDSKGWTPRNEALRSITADLKFRSRNASHFRTLKHKQKRNLDIWFVDIKFILLQLYFYIFGYHNRSHRSNSLRLHNSIEPTQLLTLLRWFSLRRFYLTLKVSKVVTLCLCHQ